MDFDTFWTAYPRKIAKKAALKAWNRALRETTPEMVLACLEQHKRHVWRNRSLEYIPHASTWLNRESFEIEERTEMLEDDRTPESFGISKEMIEQLRAREVSR